ncbi:hypothetical protein BKA70DRAFT_1100590 [Coprinopsis sp. MPI-PUGE-AT-0042]|nr:hypothetical protein BKA70DRAFT_1100590 [Coprinopsis sp. MPI-PUGE-AT-0042]
MTRSTQLPSGEVHIFWDTRGCPVPLVYTGHSLAARIIDTVKKYGAVTSFKAYLGPEEFSQEFRTIRSELQLSGVSLTHSPRVTGTDETLDNVVTMTVDVLASCIGASSLTLVLIIKGANDFSYALNPLRERGHRIVLITTGPVDENMSALADERIQWSKVQQDLPFRPQHIGASSKPVPCESITKASFQPLVDLLQRERKQGVQVIAVHEVGSKIAKTAEERIEVYRRAGVKKLMRYIALAVQYGVVTEEYRKTRKGNESKQWISLA